MAAMRAINIRDGNNGSKRLYAYACRCVEHGARWTDVTDAPQT
jgi:hypothetical protein